MSIGDERETELQRRANRKKLTIPQLRQELTKHNIGYMSNWTKPVLLRRLEENDKWLDYQANQIDAFQAFRDKKENLQSQADYLLKEMEALNDAKNSLAKRRVKILEEVKKLDAVLEMTEPTF